MGFGIEGERVRLVPLDEERHFENCYRWINDPEITATLMADGFMTRLAEQEWFKGACLSKSDIYFAIELLDGTHIGNTALHGVNYQHGSAISGTLIGDKSQWGKGYASEAVRLRTRFAFETLGLRLILSAYLGDNGASWRMQQKSGYQEIGRIPKRFWKRGQYVDEVLTMCTRESAIAAGVLSLPER